MSKTRLQAVLGGVGARVGRDADASLAEVAGAVGRAGACLCQRALVAVGAAAVDIRLLKVTHWGDILKSEVLLFEVR